MMHVKISESGQVGMTVLLVMVVMITVAIAVAERSISNLNLSRREQESTRSLDLAESGLDEIMSRVGLVSGQVYSTIIPGTGKTAYVSVSNLNGINAMKVSEGHVLELNLGGLTTSLNISWPSFDCSAPLDDASAIEVTLIKEDGSYYANRYAFDQCATQRLNGFQVVSDSSGIVTATLGATVVSGYQMARIKVLYAPTYLTVEGAGLPVQGLKGVASASDTTETTTAVALSRYNGSLPSILDYVVFSGTTIN